MEEKKKSWFRRHWILTTLLFIAVIGIIGGALSPKDNGNSSGGSQLRVIDNGIAKVSGPTSTSINKEDLPCRQVIPNRLNLECKDLPRDDGGVTHWCNYINNTNYYWADGTSLGPWTHNLQFWNNAGAGQNINYLYMGSSVLTYEKENIASDGTIMPSLMYGITLAIDPSDVNTEGYRVAQYKCHYDGNKFDSDSFNKWRPM